MSFDVYDYKEELIFTAEKSFHSNVCVVKSSSIITFSGSAPNSISVFRISFIILTLPEI